MFRKILSFVLTTLMLVSSAQANVQEGFRTAIEDYRYSLTVEWDQRDEDFFQKETEQFKQTLLALHQQGLTHKDVVSYVRDDLNQKELANKLELAYKMGPEEGEKFFNESLHQFGVKGASWTADDASQVLLFLGFTAGLTMFIFILGRVSDSAKSR